MVRYSCDFENTVNVPIGEKVPKDTRVWSFGIMELFNHENYIEGTEIDDYFTYLLMVKEKKMECYFHNLKYDGTMLLDWLLKNGYEYNPERKKQPNTFRTLISKFGVFYSIELHLKGNKTISFYDSSKKIPLSVKAIADSYNLPMKKGEIDYKKPRPKGYIPTQDEREYQKNDCEIVAFGLEHQFEQQLNKMTIGSDALTWYKEKCIGKKNFDDTFPKLSAETDDYIRRSYRGGVVAVKGKN